MKMTAQVTALFLMCFCSLQDAELKRQLEALKSDDISVRERAMTALETTPLERLPLLEPALDSDDPEIRGRVRVAVTGALCHSLGRHLVRFALKPVATREVMEKWIKEGRDQAKVPKGYELVSAPEHFQKLGPECEYLKTELILVESSAVVTHEGIKATELTEDARPGGPLWTVNFALTDEASKRFDTTAERLFNQKPSGFLAILVDGKIVSAPQVRSPSFHGTGSIVGGASKEEAERTAAVLRGEWFEITFRVVREAKSAPGVDEIVRLVKGTTGFSRAEVLKTDEKECTIRTSYDARTHDLLSLWSSLRRRSCAFLPEKVSPLR